MRSTRKGREVIEEGIHNADKTKDQVLGNIAQLKNCVEKEMESIKHALKRKHNTKKLQAHSRQKVVRHEYDTNKTINHICLLNEPHGVVT